MILLLDAVIHLEGNSKVIVEQTATNFWIDYAPLLISLVGLGIAIYNWYNARPKVKFFDCYDFKSFYKPTYEREYNYKDSTTIAFVYAEIANPSSTPCTIGQFTLSVDGYKDTYSRATHKINDEYVIATKNDGNQMIIEKNSILETSCTLPPYGFASGYIVFPYCQDYKGDTLSCTIKARVGKKYFKISQNLYSLEHIQNHQDHQ